MQRPRYRIRYRKLDDLRLVGHQDLSRLWERLLRRAEVKPAMSEGFHRRPRVNFPSALAVGISGLDEVMELELSAECDPADLAEALRRQTPAGLSIVSVEPMGDGTRFSQPATATYEVPLPAHAVAGVKARIEARRAIAVRPGDEPSPTAAADVAVETESAEPGRPPATLPAESAAAEPAGPEPWPASVRSLDVVDGVLRMHLRLGEAGALRPRDLLALLELAELESEGVQITRTRVELSP
jgi:hypothetical protein